MRSRSRSPPARAGVPPGPVRSFPRQLCYRCALHLLEQARRLGATWRSLYDTAWLAFGAWFGAEALRFWESGYYHRESPPLPSYEEFWERLEGVA